ncbi:hypothetical protein [Peribacillus sp. NPDC096540]|uniref:hypothetical protein n=1 Tax=Peribacillus sp. NPDC096540 TaxID=3390612 RepID=UPI003D00D443
MSKLDPRPNSKPLYSWQELNEYLQLNFKAPGNLETTIDVRNYSMSKDEIIHEAEKQGYKVYEKGEHQLEFK